MIVELKCYPYHFVQRVDDPSISQNSFLKYKLLYSFKSPKSHQWYWVWVEVYMHNMYAVKFHLKSHRDSRNKYSIMTGLNEPRAVVNTCVAIMLEIAAIDSHASFGFIGAASESEDEANTKRFRFYKRLMATYFSKAEFRHFGDTEKSTYILIRHKELAEHPTLIEDIEQGFKATFDYFD